VGQYKVIQDIEAEDKLLGPLTLRQFIYAAVFFVLGFLAYKISIAVHSFYVVIIFLPPMAFFGLLAAPLGKEQPNEIWLLAKFKFLFKPQLRKWDQEGLSGLITITVPKVVHKQLTKNFTGVEAKSKLENIAKILDSGGVPVTRTFIANYNTSDDESDRLIDFDMGDNTVVDPAADSDIFSDDNFKSQRISNVLSSETKKQQEYKLSLLSSSRVDPVISSDPRSTAITHLNGTKIYPAINSDKPVDNPDIANPFKSQPKPENTNTPVTSQALSDKISLLARDNNRSIASIDRELKGGANSGEVVINLH